MDHGGPFWWDVLLGKGATHIFLQKKLQETNDFCGEKTCFQGQTCFFRFREAKNQHQTQRSSLNQSDRKPLSRPTSMTSPKAVKDLLMDCAWCFASPKQVTPIDGGTEFLCRTGYLFGRTFLEFSTSWKSSHIIETHTKKHKSRKR